MNWYIEPDKELNGLRLMNWNLKLIIQMLGWSLMRGPCNIVQEEASMTLLPRFERQRRTLDSIMFMCNKFYIHIF